MWAIGSHCQTKALGQSQSYSKKLPSQVSAKVVGGTDSILHIEKMRVAFRVDPSSPEKEIIQIPSIYHHQRHSLLNYML